MLEHELEEWSWYWTDKKSDYVLVYANDDCDQQIKNSLIFNVRECCWNLIEDNELAELIKQRMLGAGVPIVTMEYIAKVKNDLEYRINEMLERGEAPRLINEMIRSYTRESDVE